MNVYYLGPPGTFSEEAAQYFARRLGMAVTDAVPVATISNVIERVYQEKTTSLAPQSVGCVPLENSIQGSVTMAWDTLGRICREEQERVSASPLEQRPTPLPGPTSPVIVASYTLTIEQFLLTVPDTDLMKVDEVLSHPQGLAQCADWLREHLPQASQIPVSSTADAARIVAARGNPNKVAIGPRAAGELYNLQLSSSPIQDASVNQTRFGLIALHGRKPDVANWCSGGRWTLSLVLAGVDNAPGGLYRSLQPFHKEGFNLTRIESRPSGSLLGEYLFFLDVEWPYERRLPEETPTWLEVEQELRDHSIQVVRLGIFPEVNCE